MTASTGKGRGGPRAGSGRKPKNRGALPVIDIAHALAEPAPEDIEAAARSHAVMAVASLLTILISAKSRSSPSPRRTHLFKMPTTAYDAEPSIIIRGVIKPFCEI